MVYNMYRMYRSSTPHYCLRAIKRLQLRHKPHPLPSLFPLELRAHNATSTAINHMLPQHTHDLAILPPLRHRSIRRLERPNRLRPLPTSRRARNPPPIRPAKWPPIRSALRFIRHSLSLRLGCRESRPSAFSIRERGRRWFLRGPVVDIPVILVKEKIVLLQLRRRHRSEMCVGEGGEQEIRL